MKKIKPATIRTIRKKIIGKPDEPIFMDELKLEGPYIKPGFTHFNTKIWAEIGFKINVCRNLEYPQLEEFEPIWTALFYDGKRTLRIRRSRDRDDSAMAVVQDETRPNPWEHHLVSEKTAVSWFSRASKVFYERVMRTRLGKSQVFLPPWTWREKGERAPTDAAQARWYKSLSQSVARGALFGALIGDAAGARLEFLGRPPTDSECEKALSMAGGGILNTAPGQITDDGELTLCLAQSLIGHDSYDPDRAAEKYIAWYQSNPFDIGNATRNAFSVLVPQGASPSKVMRTAAALNANSKANGALMRATPLGLWGTRLSYEQLRDASFSDTNLSHPNLTCQYATAAYAIAISHLVQHPGDSDGAIDEAESVLTESGAEEVSGWLADSLAGVNPGYYPQAGFVRYGFTQAFRHLARGTAYVDAIKETLLGGGDTDTNACIVGGLIGALHTDTGIPEQMKNALLECDTRKGNPRPAWLSTRKLQATAAALLK